MAPEAADGLPRDRSSGNRGLLAANALVRKNPFSIGDLLKLLLDLTPLDSPTRHRGNGRYLRELALGLSELPARALGSLSSWL